jgi:16S rRNA (cytosine1402-N4)-methyltransferase
MTLAAQPLEQFDRQAGGSYAHVTVMPREVVRALAPERGGIYLDVTAGGGGHAEAILRAGPSARLVAFDRDPAAVMATRERLAEFGERATVVQAAFDELPEWLARAGLGLVQGLVADLGLSSQQLADPTRGMSFRSEGPLDMRMDPTGGETASELIERLSVDELADRIYQLGEERRSRRVARCIKQAAAEGQLESTLDLRRAVVRAVGPRRIGGIDPATRTFQALRILVNREVEQLERLLGLLPALLEPGGVAAVISFHSLEDRLVKRAFMDASLWQRLSTKPMVPSAEEQARNPRSRSAKLRAARRVSAEGASA